jgi:hypothetical protein
MCPRVLAGSSIFLGVVGLLSLAFSGVLLTVHLREVTAVRETALPLLASLPPLERRLALLKEQVEVAELDAALKTGSVIERVRVSVLPQKTDLPRALASFEVLRVALEERGLLSTMSPIEVGKEAPYREGTAGTPLTVEFKARGSGIRQILTFLRLAGLVTIGDALTPAEKNALILATEEENPAGIVALEQFFAADLFTYAREPRPFEEQLHRSLQSEGFLAAFRAATEASLLRDAKTLFQGPIGHAIEQRRLWPMEFLTIDRIELRPGASPDWYRMNVTLSLLRRSV